MKALDRAIDKASPTANIVISFAILIFTGAVLLWLPFSSAEGISTTFLDALFTSTSAVCVTGLTTVTTASNWSFFGKLVIILLVQTGALGLISFYMSFAVISGKKISIQDRLIIRDTFNQDYISGSVGLLKKVFLITLMIETVGAAIIGTFFFIKGENPITSLGYGVFHAVTAFCNSGMDILGDNSLSDYNNNGILLFTVAFLITLGGIGFSTMMNVRDRHKARKEVSGLKKPKLTLNTKIVLIMTGSILLFGTVFFFLAEYNNPATFGVLTLKEKITASFFHTATLRTAGFYSTSINDLSYASKFMSCIIMFIGGSSGGTAGGIKTVTFAVVIYSVISILKGREDIIIFNRKINIAQLQKALVVLVLYLGIIVVATMLLTVTEKETLANYEFIDILFETVSATSTTGISVGLTPLLTPVGKITLILCMFMGRVGPLTIIMLLAARQKTAFVGYPEEKVMIG